MLAKYKTIIISIAALSVAAIVNIAIPATSQAAAAPESCFAFDVATGTILDYGDEITNTANPNNADSRDRGTCPTELEIPSEIGGVAVVKIGVSAFSRNDLASAIIPDSVTNVEAGAFQRNQLTTVTFYGATEAADSYFTVFGHNPLGSITYNGTKIGKKSELRRESAAA